MINSSYALSIICTNQFNETLDLRFKLFANDLASRWIKLVDRSISEKKQLSVNHSRHMNKKELQALFEKFCSIIKTINSNYDKQLIIPLSLDHLFNDGKILNNLHAEFEIYGDRINGTDNKKIDFKSNSVLHENMLRLNDKIHNFEDIILNHKRNRPQHCGALIDWLPAGLHSQLLPQDYLLFSQDAFWGYLYLGYNTLGKNWWAVCRDNDLDVIERNAVRPQQRFAAEFRINLTVKGENYGMQHMFYNWIEKNNLIDKIDFKSALGEIPLGRLDQYNLNDEWYLADNLYSDKNLQILWNKQIWSRFTEVIDVKLITHTVS